MEPYSNKEREVDSSTGAYDVDYEYTPTADQLAGLVSQSAFCSQVRLTRDSRLLRNEESINGQGANGQDIDAQYRYLGC